MLLRRLTLLSLAAASSTAALADPWINPGDARLRHDLQLLADAGVIHAPVTTWPLPWASIADDLASADETAATPAIGAALVRTKRQLSLASNTVTRGNTRVSAATDDLPLRTFSQQPREQGEAELGLTWAGERFAYRAQITGAYDPDDDKEVRPDGSYLAGYLGNWAISAGWQDRWWGPGWDGSLILSNNARPVPALTLQRRAATAFESPWLSWIGPWQFTTFFGQLESNRDIPDAKLFGMRLNFRPFDSLELGLSRTAQWGGEGRPQDLESFVDLLAGKDNRGDDNITVANEPGNQLAGYDLRWAPHFLGPTALYAQFIGEDSANGLPSRYLKLWGIELANGGLSGNSYRVHFEFADTKAWDYNYAYNHGIYTDGYRYYGRSQGHALDNDSRMFTLGVLYIDTKDRSWEARLRKMDLNWDGRGLNAVSPIAQTAWSAELVNRWFIGQNTLSVGLGVLHTDPRQTGKTETNYQAFLQWQHDL